MLKLPDKIRESITGIIFISPAIVLFLVFVVAPAFYAFLLGFTDQHLLMPESANVIGLKNYNELLKSTLFVKSLINTSLFAILIVLLQGSLALFLALLIDKKLRATNFFRSAFFAPTIMSLVVISVLWAFLLNPSVGLINAIIGRFGIPAQGFLSNENQALYSIVAISIWQGVGMQMMIFLAGLQDIPEDLYSSARVDGISKFKQFTHITWPLLRNTTLFVIVTTSIYAFKIFIQPFILTQGGPNDSTTTMVMFIYNQGFIAHRTGLSSAAAILFFIIVLCLSLFQKKFIGEGKFYD